MAAPPRVVERLAATDGAVAVLHRGRHAIYLAVGDGCVGVVSRSAAQVPCGLRVAQPDLGALAGSRTARVEDGTLLLDGVGLTVSRTVTVTVPRLPWPADPGGVLRRTAPALPRLALPRQALALLAAGDPAAVPLLVGRGDGLTPLGDDVLCGWLAAAHSLGAPMEALAAAVRDHRRATTTLSSELLDCAVRGEVLPEYGAWLSAACTGTHAGDQAAAPERDALLAVGHTSGAGLLLGALLLLDPTAPALLRSTDERLTA